MPILEVQLIGPVAEDIRQGLADRIANAVAEVLGSRPQGTWVMLQFIAADAYAENAGGAPSGVQPVIVSVLLAEPPQGAALAKQAARLTQVVAEACGRPAENVHLIFLPPGKGRVAFGGRLVE
jgi:phenylpyruvate tautomerase PptA (4-oxalocrotonate tautomerase family)